MFEEEYPKKLIKFTKIIAIINFIVGLVTPYKLEVFKASCGAVPFFFIMSLFGIPILFAMILIIFSSNKIFTTKEYKNEVAILIYSIFGILSVVFANYGVLVIVLCGSYIDVYMPSYYIALIVFTYFIGLSIYMITKKIKSKNLENEVDNREETNDEEERKE